MLCVQCQDCQESRMSTIKRSESSQEVAVGFSRLRCSIPHNCNTSVKKTKRVPSSRRNQFVRHRILRFVFFDLGWFASDFNLTYVLFTYLVSILRYKLFQMFSFLSNGNNLIYGKILFDLIERRIYNFFYLTAWEVYDFFCGWMNSNKMKRHKIVIACND